MHMFFPPESNLSLSIPKEKSSFKDFFKYNLSSSKALQRSVAHFNSTRKPPSSTPFSSSIKTQTHMNFAAKTWDAQHLQAFLETTDYVREPQPLVVFKDELWSNEQVNRNFGLNEEGGAFQDRFHDINHLVNQGKKEIETAKEFSLKFVGQHSTHIEPPDIFRPSKLERLCTAKDKMKEYVDLKQRIEDFRKEKNDFLTKNKHHRVLKKGFKSGVINVDNPENPQTELYREEYLKNKAKSERTLLKSAQRRENIENFTKTSANIAFSNKNYEPNASGAAETFWMKKSKNRNDFVIKTKDSFQRIFGENKGECTKRTWLRGGEKRDFDIISLKKE